MPRRTYKLTSPLLFAATTLMLVGCGESATVIAGRVETVLTVASEITQLATLFGTNTAVTDIASAVAILQKIVVSLAAGGVASATAAGTEAQAYHDVVLAYASLPEQFRAAITVVTLAELQKLDAAASAATATESNITALGTALEALEPALRAQLAVARATLPANPVEVLP